VNRLLPSTIFSTTIKMTEHYFVGVAPVKLFRVMEKTKIYREGDDKHLATVLLGDTGRSGTIKVIDDEAIEKSRRLDNGDNSISIYKLESRGMFFGQWRILRHDKVIATATKPAIFSGRVRLRYGKESSWIYPGIFGGIRAYSRRNRSQQLLASFSRLWYNGLKYAFAVQQEDTEVSHMFAVFNSVAFVYLYRRKRLFRFIYIKVFIGKFYIPRLLLRCFLLLLLIYLFISSGLIAVFGLALLLRLVYSWM